VDFNIPIENDTVNDSSRIKNILPTIEFLKKANAKIILISHIGKTASPNDGKSLRCVISELSNIYKSNVVFIDDCLCDMAKEIIDSSSSGDLILLENLRFHREEEECDVEFAKKLASLADFYINEAFSVSHRKHASIYAIPEFLPHALGISFRKEMEVIDNFLCAAKPPTMCIVGGSKLSTKIKLLKNLVKKVNKLALGGGIAVAFMQHHNNNFLKRSNLEESDREIIEIIDNAKKFHCDLILPVDFAARIDSNLHDNSIIISDCENTNASIFDIGPSSIDLFKRHIRESSTILWNGPVGLFEQPPFDFGTMSLATEIGELSRDGKIISIIGGGDTLFAVNKCDVSKFITHKSTSGGALLTYLEGSELPGLSALKNPCILAD
jgi:phosphoglycerate kinase